MTLICFLDTSHLSSSSHPLNQASLSSTMAWRYTQETPAPTHPWGRTTGARVAGPSPWVLEKIWITSRSLSSLWKMQRWAVLLCPSVCWVVNAANYTLFPLTLIKGWLTSLFHSISLAKLFLNLCSLKGWLAPLFHTTPLAKLFLNSHSLKEG